MCDKPLTQKDLRKIAREMPERLTAEWVNLPGTSILVTAQPIRLDGLDGPIVPVSALTTQTFADALGAYPTTATIEDMIWTQAAERMEPYCLPNDGSWAQAMKWYAHAEDWLQSKCFGPKTLISFGDKSWCPTARAKVGTAANYGLHVNELDCSGVCRWRGMLTYPSETRCGARVVQPLACEHSILSDHADYSQHCRLWKLEPGVDDTEIARIHGGNPRTLRLTEAV